MVIVIKDQTQFVNIIVRPRSCHYHVFTETTAMITRSDPTVQQSKSNGALGLCVNLVSEDSAT